MGLTPKDLAALGGLRLGALPEDIAAPCADSRKVGRGDVFVAIKGTASDGAAYIKAAEAQGAALAVVSLEGAVTARQQGAILPLLIVDDPRAALSELAARLAGAQPAHIVAVTGTSGKSSVVDFLRQIWGGLGLRAASMGTIGVQLAGDLPPASAQELAHTTPDPAVLHQQLAALKALGCDYIGLEASSHGLDQRRLEALHIRAAGLTNITRDHMDYHPTAAHYAAAKLRLFSELLPSEGAAVVNADDPAFAIASDIAAARGLHLLPYGQNAPRGLHLLATECMGGGQAVRFAYAGQEHALKLALVGSFQAMNVLCAAGLAIGTGAPAADVFAQLEGLKGVRGRMEHVGSRKNGAAVYVDYAHKPDAVAAALRALRPHAEGEVHIILGAGGDRDPGKRLLMGQAADELADQVIITDDNPRSEDPAAIREAMLKGAPEALEIGDRAEAIHYGISRLQKGDVLLIAGKGHEQGQTVGGVVRPFDDREVAQDAIGR